MLHVDGTALVRKARIARDHEQPRQAGNRRRDLLGDAVDEVILLRITRHVFERQDCERRRVGQRQRRIRARRLREWNAVDAQRPAQCS